VIIEFNGIKNGHTLIDISCIEAAEERSNGSNIYMKSGKQFSVKESLKTVDYYMRNNKESNSSENEHGQTIRI